MKVLKLVATLALSAILFTGCGINSQKAIITVNDKPITLSQYNELIDKSIETSPLGKMGDLKANKDGFLYLMMEQQVVNQLIIQELLNQEAEERGIKISNKDVDEALKKIIDQMGGKDKLLEALKNNGVKVSEFKEDLKTQLKMQKLAESVEKIEISDKDCEKFYKENSDEFKYPEQVRASHILIAANAYQMQQVLTKDGKKKIEQDVLKEKIEKQLADKKALAEKLDKELKADPSKFEEYAKKYSDDETSAKQGGDLGFFSKERMVPEFSNVAFSAKPNTVSDVVKTQFGYHIIMVKDRAEAGVTPYEKVQSSIKEYLKTQKQIKILDDLTTAAKKKSKIEFVESRYNPDEIQKKLTNQVDDITDGQASKIREADKAKESAKKDKK